MIKVFAGLIIGLLIGGRLSLVRHPGAQSPPSFSGHFSWWPDRSGLRGAQQR